MGNKYLDKQRDDENATDYSNEWTMVRDSKPGRTLTLKLLQSEICVSWFQELFLQRYIPKQVESIDEKYLKQCIEVIHANSLNSRFVDKVFVPEHMLFEPNIAIDYPMTDGIGDVVFRSDIHGSPSQLPPSPAPKSTKETSGFGNRGYHSAYVQSNHVSISGSGSASGSGSSQGMLQCTWDDGIPHFAFQLDDQKEVYVANFAKAEVIHEKEADYIYSFYFKANDQNLSDLSGIECDLIGKMKVSTSFTICSSNSKVIETEFVLVGTSDNHAREEIHQPSRNSRLSRKLSKVTDMFKSGPSLKNRAVSKFIGSSAIFEDISENDFIPNLEVAAVVVKEHLKNDDQQEETGGWGLKFLQKCRLKSAVENCSTSMDIIVPAGPHGGPRMRIGGPSSLVERWRSGGSCDCGGWDIGCPLKVLKARPTSESPSDCRSFDMIAEGSEHAPAKLKMVNIRDGLYFISFQSTFLSALQCFAIVVATIHSKTPSLSPKHVQS